MSPDFCESLRRLLSLAAVVPFTLPLTPAAPSGVAPNECWDAGGGLFELIDGDGEEWEDLVPFVLV